MIAGRAIQVIPSPSYSQAIAGVTSPSETHLPKPRGPKAGGETPVMESEGGVCPGPTRAVPGQPQALVPGVKPTVMS